MHPHWNSTPKAAPTTDERLAALEELAAGLERTLSEARVKIASLEAKVQAREPIGHIAVDTRTRIQDHIAGLEVDRIRREARAQHAEWFKRGYEDNRKPAQPDLFPSHKPLEPRYTPRQFLDIEKRQEAWARGHVDPHRMDQGKAVVLPSGVKITGVSGAAGSVGELINQFWANAQATQAQADRDGENLKK